MLVPFLAFSVNVTPFFFDSAFHQSFIILTFLRRFDKAEMQQTDAGSREWERQRKREREKEETRVRDGESSSQATGGFRSMHPYARLPTRVRRPASFPDVILPYPRSRVILTLLFLYIVDTDAMAVVGRTKFSKSGSDPPRSHIGLRRPLWNCFLIILLSMNLKKRDPLSVWHFFLVGDWDL